MLKWTWCTFQFVSESWLTRKKCSVSFYFSLIYVNVKTAPLSANRWHVQIQDPVMALKCHSVMSESLRHAAQPTLNLSSTMTWNAHNNARMNSRQRCKHLGLIRISFTLNNNEQRHCHSLSATTADTRRAGHASTPQRAPQSPDIDWCMWRRPTVCEQVEDILLL